MSQDNLTTERPGQKLGLFAAIALVMGTMIGTGVFLLPAQLAPYGWNAVAGWIITIGGAVCLAYVMAALGQRHARAIGAAELVEQSFGRIPGFLIGFSFWVSVWTGMATLGVGAVSYLSGFVPWLGDHPAIGALGVVWLVSLINIVSVRAGGAFQVATMLLKLVPLITVIAIIAAVLGTRGPAMLAPFPAEGLQLGAVNTAAAIALWAMVGFESACGAAHKIADPQRNVARAIVVGASLSGLIYLIVCSGIALMLPVDQVAGSAAPFEIFVSTFWSPQVATFIALFAAISAIGAANGWALVQGELPREMASRGMMPTWFAKTATNGVAVRGLVVSSTLTSLLVLANSSRSMAGLFAFMALLSTAATLMLYLACAAAAIKERVAVPVAVVGGIYGLWTLYGAGAEATGLSIVLMLAGLPLYWLAQRSAPFGREPAPVA